MSISVKVGKPGAGKTLVSLQLYILPALLSGRHVYHNIPGLNCVKIAYHLRNKYNRMDVTPYYVENLLHDYSIEHLLDNWQERFPKRSTVPTENDLGAYYLNSIPKAPPVSLIILDEAQKKCYINSKNWKEERNRKFFEYCSVHRKSKHEVLIITQDDDNIDSSVNGIREELIFLMRQERLGFFFKDRVKLNYILGHQTIRNSPYATSNVGYDKAVFDLYQSYAPNLPGNVKEVRKVKFFLSNAKFIFFAVAGVVLFTCGAPNTVRLMQGKGFKKHSISSSSVSSSSFSLGEYDEYYCGEKFFVLRPGGMVDTLEPRNVPPSYCPKFNFHFMRIVK